MGQGLAGVQRVLADFRGQLHVFQGGQVLHQIIELEYKAHVVPSVAGKLLLIIIADPASIQQNSAFVAGIHAAEHVQHGSFSSAAGTHDHTEFPLVNFKGNLISGLDRDLAHAVNFRDLVKGHKMAHNAPAFLIFRNIIIVFLKEKFVKILCTKRRKDWTNPAEAVSIKGKNKKGDTSDGISNEGIRRGTAARDDGNMERRRGGGNQLSWR